MSVSSESAEQLMRITIEGEEVCLKIAGKAAKELAVIIAAMLKNRTQTKGKARLNTMLKSGKELKIFSVQKQDLEKFTSEAKRYGVLYCALVNKHNKNHDGMVDIMVRAEDASKINRIVERFKIATVNEAEIRTQIQKTKEEKKVKVPDEKQIGVELKDMEIKEMEKQELAPIQTEEKSVPLLEKNSKENLSENLLKTSKKQEGKSIIKKKSVRAKLQEIKEEMTKDNKSASKQKNLQNQNKSKSQKKKTKER